MLCVCWCVCVGVCGGVCAESVCGDVGFVFWCCGVLCFLVCCVCGVVCVVCVWRGLARGKPDVCGFKTSPCVGSKRIRVYRQNARMLRWSHCVCDVVFLSDAFPLDRRVVGELTTTLGHQDLANLSSAYSRKETSLLHLMWGSTCVSLVLVVLSWSSPAALFRSNLYASFSHVKCISGPPASGSFTTNVHVDIMREGSNMLTITQA